jgi:DNA primase
MIKLERYQIEQIINLLPLQKLKDKGNYYSALCPFHTEKTPSFGINKDGLWNCFGCPEHGNINTLIYKLTGKNIYKFLGITDISSFAFNSSLEYKSNEKIRDKPEIKIPEIQGNLYNVFDNKEVYDYLKFRKCSDEFIIYFDIKYCTYIKINGTEFRNRLIIPIYEDGRLISYEGRDFTQQQKPKCLYPKNGTVSTLFNIDDLDFNEEVILVEGFFDLPLIWQNISKNCSHIFGASLSSYQKDLINKFKKVIYFRDNDSAGESTIKELDKYLEKDFYIAESKIEGQDPGDLDLSELQQCLSNKKLSVKYFLDKSMLFEKQNIGW